MKKILLLAFVFAGCFSAQAQMGGMTGGGKGAQQAPNMGHVYGKVIDSSGKPLPDISVLLLQNKYDSVSKKRKDILLKGSSTKNNGEFDFADLPMFGQLKLKISGVGFKTHEQTVSFQMKMDAAPSPAGASADPAKAMAAASSIMSAFDKDLGNIKLLSDPSQLQSVTVTASKPLIKMDIDKRVFNVDKNIVSAGGTALDIMKNVPGLQVDIDGNVLLRNASPQIYIDGRPTTLSLDQIPADAIESVEVITNPSAKYDASGGNAGILNIVLKKNKKTGYNGNLMAGVDKRGAVNGGGNFNVRQGKFNFSAALMANQMKSYSEGTTERLNLLDTPQTLINQVNDNKTKGGFYFGRLGMDYFVTNRTTFSLSGIKVHGEFNPTESIDITTDSLYSTGTTSSYRERNTGSSREFNANGLQFGMKHLFPKQGEELTADVNFFSGKNKGYSDITTDYYDYAGSGKTSSLYQKIENNGTNKFLTLQTDYVRPFKGKTKLETGLRAQLRNISNNNYNYVLDEASGEYILLPNAASNYKNEDNVYAAYVSFTSAIKDFGYQLGLRAESSEYEGELTNTGEKFSNSYPISLFPSIFLSQKLKNKQELQFSVTRRVNRPNFFQLIPFVDYSDPLNITRGNPNLVPEFTSSLELSYSKTLKGNHSILASAYYKKTDNLITRYQEPATHPVTGQEVLINTYINANSSYTMGSELTIVNPATKWLDLTTNINIYNSKINTENIKESVQQEAMWSWFGKFNSNFKLPKKFTIQLSATFQSKTNLPVNQGGGFGPPMMQSQSASQGYIKPAYGVDLAFKKSFLKNDAASVTLSVTDIFKTRWQKQYSYSQYFMQDYSRIRDPQMIKLNFTYRFGKIDVALFKRQNMKSQGEGMQNGMQGVQ